MSIKHTTHRNSAGPLPKIPAKLRNNVNFAVNYGKKEYIRSEENQPQTSI